MNRFPNQSLADKIVRAVLYEGYILYPYRPSVKSQQPWTFGGIYPKAFSEAQEGSDPYLMQTQCLLQAGPNAAIALQVCFLHLTARTVEAVVLGSIGGEPEYRPVPTLEVAGRLFQTWQEAGERKIDLGELHISDLLRQHRHETFSFPYIHSVEPLIDPNDPIGDRTVGRLVREQQQIDGTIEVWAEEMSDGVYEITARVLNLTPVENPGGASRDVVQLKSFASTHMILTTHNGEFASLTDPPEMLSHIASHCSNLGCWPVLVGKAAATDTLLVSPIILSDYPEVAPESPGDLFDGCEIDEILTLRILTLTDEEKRQAMAVDPLPAKLMARTEALPRDQLMNLHGTVRGLSTVAAASSSTEEDQPPVSEQYYG
jgi:hypothetical protein